MLIIIGIAIASFVAGMVNAIAGGGTFLTFPILTGVGGLTEKVANMTNTIGLWPAAAASVGEARADLHRLPRGTIPIFGAISFIGAIGGAVLLRITSAESFSLAIPWLLGFATILFAFSKPIARWSGRHHGGQSRQWTLLVIGVQFLVAIYVGYFGAGAGVLMLAGLAFAGFDDIHQVNALKVLLNTIMNGVASVIFIIGRAIDWRMAAIMACASVLGGIMGMRFSRRLPQQKLRYLIMAIGVVLTIAYAVKNYRI